MTKPGKDRSSAGAAALLLACAGLVGCAAGRANVEKGLIADKDAAALQQGVTENYQVGCPDIVEIRIADRPELSGKHALGPDGRIDLGDYGKLRIEGRTLEEIARLVARETGTSPGTVQVRVVEYRSQFVVLFGQVVGWQRTVPYRGQETVLDVLQRVGGITPGAEPEELYVVRPHLGGQRPEVFHVDLQAIVLKQDHRTNLRLLPFDQVYVGATRQTRVEKSFPPWLRPAYQAVWNMRPGTRPPPPSQAPPRSRWVAGKTEAAAAE